MLFLADMAGFVVAKWRVFAVGAGILVLLFAVAVAWKRCNPPPKLDEKQIQKAQDAIAKRDREKMLDVLAESDTREASIDSNIKQIENDREAAKQNYSGKSNDDLAAELEKRVQQP